MRKHSGKALVKVLISIVVVVVVLAAAGFILFRTGKTVGVAYTSADLDSYTRKTGVVFDDKSAGYEAYVKGSFKGIGSKAITGSLTNSEISAVVNRTASAAGAAKNFAIRFHKDGVTEVSFTLDKNLDVLYQLAPEAKKYDSVLKLAAGSHIYYKFDIDYLGNEKFEAVSQQLYLGQIALPIDKVNEESKPLGTAVNNIIGKIEGLDIKKLEFTDDGLNFDGSIPEKVIDTSK